MLEVKNLAVHFPVTRGSLIRREIGSVKAVDNVSFVLQKGSVLGLVGESGCGKTTVARAVLKLQPPTAGQVLFTDEDIWSQTAHSERAYRRRVQAVFQDPMSSLNPRMRVRDIVSEPLLVHDASSDRNGRYKRASELLEQCGLPQRFLRSFPHEMSGGQRQRVGIARALALNPELIVCDEAVSALDVSIQAQIINLLSTLRRELNLTYLFIGHDLSVIRHLCDTVAVMYLGKIVEHGQSEMLFNSPRHPYTRALLAAIPIPDPKIEAQQPHVPLSGEVPSPLNPPPGCAFHPRCPLAIARCQTESPPLRATPAGHLSACWVTADPPIS